MPSKYGNTAFYNSKAWKKVSSAYMASKLYTCERCGKPAQICHHRRYLDSQNVSDPEISLNPDNLEALCIECHNEEHSTKHNVTIFDDTGNVIAVKESPGTKVYQEQRSQIDDVVAKARSLLCGFSK